MRLFTSEENKLIKKFVEIFQRSRPESLADLQVSKLLRNELDFFAIKWSVDPIEEVTIFIPEKDIIDKKKNDELYFDIVNFIYFLEELEEIGFIKFQNIPSSKEENFTILYDRDKYTYNPENNSFWENMNLPQKDGTFIKTQGHILLKELHTFKTSFAKDLQYCALSIIYPLPLAEDYIKNDYRTLEQRQFEEQLTTALDSARSSRKATILGFTSVIIAIIALIVSIYYYRKPTSIDNNDLLRIESAINSIHLDEPIKTTTNDTIVIM